MRREDITQALEQMDFPPLSQAGVKEWQVIMDAAAAELRKTCSTCEHFERPSGHCGLMGVFVRKNGSGFCYHHEANL